MSWSDSHHENSPEYKGLSVNKGIDKPDSVNRSAVDRFLKAKRKELTAEDYYSGIIAGDVAILSKAVTIIESSNPKHMAISNRIIELCLPHSGNSVRVGVTGVPGAGKSTFIEAFGKHLTGLDHKIAVLAIDPSSERTKGSILGDKTRMEILSRDHNAYIRPSPSAGSLGGVTRKSRETIILCEAAGYDTIVIETVGVGQSEIAVHSMVDFFLLVQIAGAGDELQGIKRGIMEMSDSIVINKADGDNIGKAKLAAAQFKNALRLFPAPESGVEPEVTTCSALNKEGISNVWNIISDHVSKTRDSGYFKDRRGEQSKYWMFETINEKLSSSFYSNSKIGSLIETLETDVRDNKVSSYQAADKLLELYFNNK